MPERHVFVDRLEAVGTARANEQVTLASPVTERIERINFQDGQFVPRGQVIAVLANQRQVAMLAGARAQLRLADQQLARLNALRPRGFVTNATVDTQIAAATSARATAEEAMAQINDRTIRAPFSGYASLRTISAGAVVNQGTPIATISDLSRIKLDFAVPETMLSSSAPGQAIEVRSAAYPDEPVTGRIATIDPVIDPDTRAVSVRAILPNPGLRLKPGMLLNVSVPARSRSGRAVPELAIVGEGEQRYLFAVGPDMKTRRVVVKTGARDRGMVEISGDLRPTDKIVTEGVVKLSDGMKVRLAPAGKP